MDIIHVRFLPQDFRNHIGVEYEYESPLDSRSPASNRLTIAMVAWVVDKAPQVCSGSAAGPVRILGYFGSFTANRSTCSIFGG